MIDVARELGKHFGDDALSYARARFDSREVSCVAPDSLEGIVEAVRFAAREKLALVPLGLGSKLGWCRPPERADFLLSTRRFAGVVSHVPDDGTIALRAGTTLSEARAIASAGGHWLTPDVTSPGAKTIGGVIAAGESGLDRVRFGPVRHHVLGLKVVLADGSVTKCGGQLVKNVTGFDLMRLYTGSHGTLCVIVEAALRLFPAPEEELLLEAPVSAASEAFAAARAASSTNARLARAAIEFRRLSVGEDWRFVALAIGRREVVTHERQLLERALPRAEFLTGANAHILAQSDSSDLALDDPRTPVLHVECTPSSIEAVWRVCSACAVTRATIQPSLATIDAELGELSGLAALRHELEAAGARVLVRNAPSSSLAGTDLAAEPPGLDLMRALQQQLDPQGVFARGRLHREL